MSWVLSNKKGSGGGSNVVANPTGTATDTLNKLQVDETIYRIEGAVHYSTDEQVVGTWIDGKPLYEKTIINSNPTYVKVGNVYEVTTDVSFSGIDEIVYLMPMALSSTSSRTFGARTDLDVFEYCACNLQNNLIYMATSSNNYSKLIFIIRYTKN